jgi:hypothetical protein
MKLKLNQDDVFRYLESLRKSGVTNMWGAVPYLERDMECSHEEASHWLLTWIKSFEEK